MKSKFLKLALTLLVSSMILPSLRAQEKGEGQKIIFQLTDDNPRSHKALVGQLNNLTEGWPEANIEVVCHSAGISLLLKDKTQYAEELKTLTEKGVVFAACENTMKAHQLERRQMLPFIEYVPMGIAEIVMKQQQGWNYIKAGL